MGQDDSNNMRRTYEYNKMLQNFVNNINNGAINNFYEFKKEYLLTKNYAMEDCDFCQITLPREISNALKINNKPNSEINTHWDSSARKCHIVSGLQTFADFHKNLTNLAPIPTPTPIPTSTPTPTPTTEKVVSITKRVEDLEQQTNSINNTNKIIMGVTMFTIAAFFTKNVINRNTKQ